MAVDTDRLIKAIADRLAERAAEPGRERVGTVLEAGDGIVRLDGLADCRAGEMVEFEDGQRGVALNLEEESIGAVVLGEDRTIREGQTVKATGRILEVPVGKQLLGRVVSPLGEPLDGGPAIKAEKFRPVERVAPGVITRESVSQPLLSGTKAIDAMVPIGRGQRELIIGDRQTGKTAIAIDAIINQRHTHTSGERPVYCVYVGIGQKASKVARIVASLREAGAMEYTTIVLAAASDSAPMLFLAPYAGCAMGEEFMESGADALIVYDDLSKHAAAYRQISLLLRRPPGREAYPGDVFYLHSRLLERAARLSASYGGGSLTALPIIETQAGDLSAYIPTNVISITDGQIFLEADLFYQGVRPAINAGLSVSRVGSAAQTKPMKRVAGKLRLEAAQYRELAAFAQFGSDLDQATQQQLARGRRIQEALKQPQYQPVPLGQQVAVLFAIQRGLADDVPVEQLAEFERALIADLTVRHADLLSQLGQPQALSAEAEAALEAAIASFKEGFTSRPS